MPRPLCLLLVGALVAALAAAGCAPTQPPSETTARVRTPNAGEPFRLALGATARRDGHTVRFVEVVEDSRCPTDVQCVTAGRAQVRLEVDGDPFVLTVPYAGQADTEASMIEWGTIQVVLTDLEPYPGPAAEGAAPQAVLITRPATV